MHKVCPQCHSDRIIVDLFLITGKYTCMDCDYEGAFIFTMDDENYMKLLEGDLEKKKETEE